MKILAVDDQKLVLLPLEKRLIALGYEVRTETNVVAAIETYKNFQPDLLIVDINMPTISGYELVDFVKNQIHDTIPVIMLSGNTDDASIVKSYTLGVDDFMKKPLSLDEISARIKRLIGPGLVSKKSMVMTNTIIDKKCVGVVIPCYNESERLSSNEFLNFIENHSGYKLCFVNDGSTDNTLEVLKNLSQDREEYITIYNCQQNGGKAEAVRQGMMYLSKDEELDYVGFLDADLSTDLFDFNELVDILETNKKYKIVSGSRITRMGANITKESARQLISLTINYIIRKILKMNFKDTQCGAKIMDRKLVDKVFDTPFITKWLFDVEMFMRIQQLNGLKQAKEMICEHPLKRWVHADGSKLSFKDSASIIFQLSKIAWVYRQKQPKHSPPAVSKSLYQA